MTCDVIAYDIDGTRRVLAKGVTEPEADRIADAADADPFNQGTEIVYRATAVAGRD